MMILKKCAGLLLFCGLFSSAANATDYVLKRDLDTRAATSCSEETAVGNFITDALKLKTGADIGLLPCSAIRGDKLYPAGSAFTPVAVAFELPLAEKAAVIEITGEQLLDAMEHAVSALPASGDTFVQVSGLRMEVDLTKAVGTRIVKLTVGGTALDFARIYKVATTEKLAGGADGFSMFTAATRVKDQSPVVADLVTTLLQEKGVKDIKVLGRIKQKR